MKTIEFISYHDRNCERMAARNGLTFHCDGYFITEHDDDRIPRPATEPELAMWQLLTGDFDPECLPATPKEVQDSLQFSKGPFTLNAIDVAAPTCSVASSVGSYAPHAITQKTPPGSAQKKPKSS
jgi:hypothetical protein